MALERLSTEEKDILGLSSIDDNLGTLDKIRASITEKKKLCGKALDLPTGKSGDHHT
jgi:hypothetical protein